MNIRILVYIILCTLYSYRGSFCISMILKKYVIELIFYLFTILTACLQYFLVFAGLYYVSYYPDTKKYHKSLLHVVARLRRVHSLNVEMDSMHRTNVDQLGLPRWCQQQLSNASKIIIVMSKDYLKVIHVFYGLTPFFFRLCLGFIS